MDDQATVTHKTSLVTQSNQLDVLVYLALRTAELDKLKEGQYLHETVYKKRHYFRKLSTQFMIKIFKNKKVSLLTAQISAKFLFSTGPKYLSNIGSTTETKFKSVRVKLTQILFILQRLQILVN